MARVQNSTAPKRREKTDATQPPSKPTKSLRAVRSGNIKTVARTRGVMSLRLGSVPMARMASTCSVTSMEPNSEAIPEEQRPATRMPVRVGPSSRTSAMATMSPVSAACPKRVNCEPVCNTITAPMKKPEINTMGREPTPMSSIWSRVS